MEVKVLKNILNANDQRAQENRDRFNSGAIFTVNVTASPGAGKTSLILALIHALRDTYRIGVVEGDVSSSIDAEAVDKEGIPVVQINTGGACHLDATMLSNAFPDLPMEGLDLLIVENVGNLICPASFALGEHLNLLVASVPEGHDKPHKYPLMFSKSDVVVLNKTDLLPYVPFNREAFAKGVRGLNDRAQIFEVSCKTGDGIEALVTWLKERVAEERARSD
jgi:hydrogenase nickel incorporation protein HypB